jgi:peptide/nickel transport system permease protein/peptide/nickel transport system substrate-binding protein
VLILADRAGMMVSPTAAKAANDDLSANPVGTGPYKFVEWQRNDHLTGTKNTSYWQPGRPYLDQITIRYIPDQQTEINAVQAGEVDFAMKIDPGNVDTLKKNDQLTVSVTPSLGLDTCFFNFSKPPFNNNDVRRAFNLAVDRDALNQAYTFGLATPANEVFPPGYWAADPALAKAFPHDVAQAKQLLAKAGYPNGLDIKAIAYDASGQQRKNEIIQSQIGEAGFKMTFDTMEVGAATSTFFEKLTYDVYCAGWSGRPDPSQTALSLFSASAFYNAGHYDSPGMADALAAAAKSSDQAERAKAFSQVIKLSQDDNLFVPLIHQADIDAMSKKVGGFQPNLYGKVDVSFLWLNS